jgi:aryl-alcohol dehydrogenase-like predicted oxidoreductase
MEYRAFGQTGLNLSVISLGGLLAHYEGVNGHPEPDVKRAIYLRALELGINVFDMGYGDEVHIPDELKGNGGDHYFSLKVGAPPADQLEATVDKHLANIRRERIDILRVHQDGYVKADDLRAKVQQLKEKGKVHSLCMIRHFGDAQQDYVDKGPEEEAEADLVIYNYVCRWQDPGLQMSKAAGKGVLIMKALGSQWISWEDKYSTDWSRATEADIVKMSPRGEGIRVDMPLLKPIVMGPWSELAEPGEVRPRTESAINWILENDAVTSVLVAFANVEELEEGVGVKQLA